MWKLRSVKMQNIPHIIIQFTRAPAKTAIKIVYWAYKSKRIKNSNSMCHCPINSRVELILIRILKVCNRIRITQTRSNLTKLCRLDPKDNTINTFKLAWIRLLRCSETSMKIVWVSSQTWQVLTSSTSYSQRCPTMTNWVRDNFLPTNYLSFQIYFSTKAPQLLISCLLLLKYRLRNSM